MFSKPLGLRSPQLACVTAELLQPAIEGRGSGALRSLLCPVPEDSLVAELHCRLLAIVSFLLFCFAFFFQWFWALHAPHNPRARHAAGRRVPGRKGWRWGYLIRVHYLGALNPNTK